MGAGPDYHEQEMGSMKLAVVALAVFGLAGCANLNATQQRMLSGGAIGAAGGAAIGAIAGGPTAVIAGALAGAGAGAIVGAATDRH
jgi:hypothetical protein